MVLFEPCGSGAGWCLSTVGDSWRSAWLTVAGGWASSFACSSRPVVEPIRFRP